MSATTQTGTTLGAATASRAVSLRWIIGARDDLVWFIGSVAASYALFALYVARLVPLVPMVVAWAVLVDAPHVFATFSRTYFDREERRARGRLVWWSLLFFAVGPAAVLAGAGFVFFFLAALWAYYHLIKQHYGFMVLYKKKNGDLDRADNFLDRAFLLLAFTYPFVAFVARDEEALRRVPAVLHSWLGRLEGVLLAAVVIAVVAWVGRQVSGATPVRQPRRRPRSLRHATGLRLPLGLRTHPLLPRLENLARAPRPRARQGTANGLRVV